MVKVDVPQLIMDCTKELMKTRTIMDISVKEICSACEISRQTFYKYFKDKYEIPGSIFYQMIQYVLKTVDYSEPWYYSIAQMMKLMQDDKPFYINAVKYAGQNPVVESMDHYIFLGYIHESEKKIGLVLDDVLVYAIQYNAHAVTGCLLDWIKCGMDEDPYIVAKKMVDCMPEKMRSRLAIN